MTDQIAKLINDGMWIPLIAYVVYCIHSYALARLESIGPRLDEIKEEIENIKEAFQNQQKGENNEETVIEDA